jgi:hypothetical protein
MQMRGSHWPLLTVTAVAAAVLTVLTVLAAAPSLAVAAPSPVAAPELARLPSGIPFQTLQLNLCNSGFASCYPTYNRGRAVGEAYNVIIARRPDLVTLNEVCQADVMTSLYPAMAANFPGSHTFWAFQPAGNRANNGQPYLCKNGDQYGIGLLGHVRSADWAGVRLFSGLYPQQYTGSNEMRAWLCAAAINNFYACTTHLVNSSGTIAMQQCKQLMDVEIPAMRAAVGAALPVVVAGDLNLRYGGSPNVQACVPPGYYRKGDGSVQHFMTTADMRFVSGQKVDLRYTDHDGWLVRVTTP